MGSRGDRTLLWGSSCRRKRMKKAAVELSGETPPTPIRVAVIDDEAPMRRAVARLIKSAGMEATIFSSAREFLGDPVHLQVDCAVTDMRMPGIDGIKLQEELSRTLPCLSLVFLTGHGNVPSSVKAMKAGAVDFLEKPVDSEALLTAVRHAAERSRALKTSHDELTALKLRYEELTARERQVLVLITAGLLNKQAAADLGVAEKTVKVHRARVMEKMGADSLAELVRMAGRLGVRTADASSSQH
jgi:FixJ family two-component response regulator